MKENHGIFYFTLFPDDLVAIQKLDTSKSVFFDHLDAETVKWFMSLVK